MDCGTQGRPQHLLRTADTALVRSLGEDAKAFPLPRRASVLCVRAHGETYGGDFALRASAAGLLAAARYPLRPLLWEKRPLLAMSTAASVLTVMAQDGSGGVTSLTEFPLAARFANASIACVKYIAKPSGLRVWPCCIRSKHPRSALPCSVSPGSRQSRSRHFSCGSGHPYVLTGWFWYLGMLVPVIGLVQVGDQSMADRHTYLPLVGFSITLIWTVADAIRGRPALRMACGTAAVAGLVLLVSGSYHQISWWKSSETLYEHTLSVTTGNYVIANNLGSYTSRSIDPSRP
jgi:hypothetical protein